MSKTLESYKDDIVQAALDWQESHPGYPGYVNEQHTKSLSGYLYDRVRRYKSALAKGKD